VTRDEVHTLLGLAPPGPVDAGPPEQAIGERAHRAFLAAHEAADVVSKPAVPLAPVVAGERADLIQAAQVPRLGDQLRPCKDRIGIDVPQNGRIGHRVAELVAAQDGRQVEPEPVDAAERERGSALIALGRVIEDDVEDDLEAGPVQGLHYVAGAIRSDPSTSLEL